MDVVVLAGGKCPPDLAAAAGVEDRAMLPIEGEPILERVLRAVEHLAAPVVIGGPPSESPRWKPGGKSFLESLAAGMELVDGDRFLVVTGDLPCLTREAVDDFIARCDPSATLNYPIVPIEAAEARFPGMKRTTLALREGRFTGGNLALATTHGMRRAMPTLRAAYEARKSPLRLAAMVGYGTLARVALARLVPASLPISALERAVGRFLGAPVSAVRTEYAEIGADVDNAAQYVAFLALTRSTEPAR